MLMPGMDGKIKYIEIVCYSSTVAQRLLKYAIHSRHKSKITPPLGPQGPPPRSDPKIFHLGIDLTSMPSLAVLGLPDPQIPGYPIFALYILISWVV